MNVNAISEAKERTVRRWSEWRWEACAFEAEDLLIGVDISEDDVGYFFPLRKAGSRFQTPQALSSAILPRLAA